MLFIKYIKELKWRFFYFIFALINCMLIIYYQIPQIIVLLIILTNKNNNLKLIATEISEIFAQYLFICVNLSALLCFPLIVYHLYAFLNNAWYKQEKLLIFNWIILSLYFYLSNILFIYNYIIPITWDFFYHFELNIANIFIIKNETKIYNYINWLFTFLFLSANLTIIPLSLVTFFENLQNIKLLKKIRKYYFIFSMSIGIILSDPNPFIQLLIAFWFIFNYEIYYLYVIIRKLKIEY